MAQAIATAYAALLRRPRVTLLVLLALCGACQKADKAAPHGGPGRVQGRILFADATIEADVRVALLRPGGAVAAEATTQIGGSFRFSGLTPGPYQLTADASGLGAASLSLMVQPGEDVRTVVHLKEPARLEGVVVDRRGQPVPEALVLVWRAGGIAQYEREAQTDVTGRFAIPRLATAAVTLFVQAPGIGSVKLERIGLPSRPLRVTLEGEGRSLRGSVSNVREAFANVAVRLGGAGLRKVRTASIDAQGAFVFHGLGSGEYSVRAGGVSQASATQAVVIEQNDVMNIALALEPGEVVSGRVIDGKSQALPGALVTVQAVPPDGCPETIASDVVGYFSTVALRRGTYQVVARAPGYVGMEPQTLAVNARPAAVTLRLQHAARIGGHVFLPDGAPASAAEVSLLSPAAPRFPRDRVPVVTGSLPLAAEAAALGTQALPHVMGSRGASTDASGGFTLGELRSGSYGLRITHPAAAPLEVPPQTLAEGAHLDFGALQLRAPSAPAPGPTITQALPPGNRVVTGHVRDPRGRGLGDVAVTVRPLDPRAVPVSSATSAVSGAFSLSRLPAVPLLLRAQHKDFGVLSVDLAPTDKTLNLKFPNPGGIEGDIVDAHGRFLSGGNVTLVAPDGSPGPPVQMAGAGFRVLGVPPGPWVIKASVPGFAPSETPVEVTPGTAPHVATVRGIRVQVRPL